MCSRHRRIEGSRHTARRPERRAGLRAVAGAEEPIALQENFDAAYTATSSHRETLEAGLRSSPLLLAVVLPDPVTRR
jgi:hypothetical protein